MSRRHLIALLEPEARPDHIKLARYVECRPDAVDYSAHYNLACYYSKRPKEEASDSDLESSFRMLRRFLLGIPPNRRTRDLSWAREDPSLKRLREAPAYKHAVEHLLRLAEGAPLTPLGRFEMLDRRSIEKLARHGVISTHDLMDHATRAFARRVLVRRTGIDEQGLYEQALLVELARRSGLDPREANLLSAAGYGSIDALAKASAKDVHSDLRAFNERGSWLYGVPSLKRAKRWIQEAISAPSEVDPLVSGITPAADQAGGSESRS